MFLIFLHLISNLMKELTIINEFKGRKLTMKIYFVDFHHNLCLLFKFTIKMLFSLKRLLQTSLKQKEMHQVMLQISYNINAPQKSSHQGLFYIITQFLNQIHQ